MSSAATFESLYANSPHFPVVPRTEGLARVEVLPSCFGHSDVTLVELRTKDGMRGEAPIGSLAASDAERDPVLVSYRVHPFPTAPVEQRSLAVSVGGKYSMDGVRKAVVAAVGKAKSLKLPAIAITLPAAWPGASLPVLAGVVTQAAVLSNYHFDRYVTKEEKAPFKLSRIVVCPPEGAAVEDIAPAVERASVLGAATILARDVANERADELHPGRMEAIAAAIAAETGAAMHVLAGEALVDAGLHMLYSVGQAARHAPRYIELAYRGDPEHPEDVILIVGKGVCFDTGGLNIKGTGFMEDMHYDKGGAAAVLGAALGVHRLGIKRNVVFVVGAVDNAVDALAYKPHNIVRSHKGLTVEVGNTDAEGRLVLGDALSYACARHKPHTVFDLATLTGACVVALGEYAAGLFSNHKGLATEVAAAGDRVYERCWPLPIMQEHRDELTTTPFADLKSTGAGRYGGACTAAAFLENFIGSEPAKAPAAAGDAAPPASAKPAWVHLDIAGPGMYSADRGHMKKGGTGFGAQLLCEYLRTAAPGAPAPVPEA